MQQPCYYFYVSLYVETYKDLHDNNRWNWGMGIRILCQNNKENVDFTETEGTFFLSVTLERPFYQW